jgi:hypothetical protein
MNRSLRETEASATFGSTLEPVLPFVPGTASVYHDRVADAGYCDIAASCLCGGMYVHAGNVPADAVLEATITSSYVARVTTVIGTSTFAVGDVICVNQSAVGSTILVPIQNGSDAAQVVPPPPDGGTCVPDYAYTVLLDDGGRPLVCNDGTQSSLQLTTDQAVTALRAKSCAASLASIDSRWSQTDCASPGGCQVGPDASGAIPFGALLALLALMRCRYRSSSCCNTRRSTCT